MKTVVYPGSFNPYHEGHKDIVRKALQTFDKVIIAIGVNPDKQKIETDIMNIINQERENIEAKRVKIDSFEGLIS